ncbi:hypothetical protein COT72_03840 [archaeon CG10_big_fil_rev_8_21_14_0_10_43_11]|nr:MAG: hypothetical protein COT72_03840 [archaeon CG10_big_fil_rev_8_21_14_0_10_43_11]
MLGGKGAVYVLLFLAPILLLPASSYAVLQNSCQTLFCLSDAYNTAGNQSITICAGTLQTVKDFNLWYDGTGPFNFSSPEFNITNATLLNGAPFDNAVGLTNETGGGCVDLVLNATNAPFTNSTIQINATLFNKTNYATTAAECAEGVGCNGSMFTINYVALHALDEDDNPIQNTLLMTYNNGTKSFIASGPAATDTSGYYAIHCLGQVDSGDCISPTPAISNNMCVTRGIPFPSEGEGPSSDCQINATASIFAFDFITSNTSAVVNITPGTALNVILQTPAAVGFVSPQLYSTSPGMPSQPNIAELNLTDYETDALVYHSVPPQGGGDGPKGGFPFFIANNHFYNIQANVSGVGLRSYPFMTPSTGMTGADITVVNTTTNYTAFIGKVINSTKNAVPNAIVYAQLYQGGGGGFGISFINSTVTDANGRFSLSVPTTQMISDDFGSYPYPIYQFYIISNETTDGVPIYFPTVETNGNRGYFAQSATVILSPLQLEDGGRVDINVTLNSAALVLSELSKVVTNGIGLLRSAVAGKINMLSIFTGVSLPQNLILSLLAPVSNDDVFFNLLGKNSTFGGGPGGSSPAIGVCQSEVTIMQGSATASTCNLSEPGSLNLSVTDFQNIFNPTGGSPQLISQFNFWFETNIVIRNSVNGKTIYYLNPDGTILQDILGFGQNPDLNISIPLPAGSYTIELAPRFEMSRFLGVYNSTAFTITAGATTNVNLRRGNAWQVQPMFPDSMTLSDNNTLFASVMGSTGPLNSTFVNLTGHILFVNKSSATDSPINFTFDPTGPGANSFNATLNASELGLIGDKYWLLLNATNSTDGVTFSSTTIFPINLFDFVLGLDLPGFSFGTGQSVSAKIFAFNATGPVAQNTSAIIVEMHDANGNAVSIVNASSGIADGEGTLNLTMPSSVGFYELTVKIEADGRYGVSNRWIQVSNLNIKVESERQKYKPEDIVKLNVEVLNAADNDPLVNATVEAVVDNSNTPIINLTGSDGKTSISLDPASLGTNGQWSFGFHNVQLKISRDTGTDVVRIETFYGFDIRGLDSFVHPDRPVYEATDDVFINMFFPPDVSISSISAVVDGNDSVSFAGEQVDGGFWHVNLSSHAVGHHDVKLTVTDANANSQKFFTGFDVNAYIIHAQTDKFSYDTNEHVNVTISVSYPNGTAIDATAVAATLFKAQPPNDINVSANVSTTNEAGRASVLLNASKPGFNYVRIVVGGQSQFIGLQVSSLKVSLLNATAGSEVTSYNATPGSFVTLFINASNSGNVPDDSVVDGIIWAFGNRIELPSNTTTDGNATISFPIPQDAPTHSYDLEVSVTTPSGERGFAPPVHFVVTGGTALNIDAKSDKPFQNPYRPGDVATFSALVSFSNNTAIAGKNVTFEIGSKTLKPTTVGTAITGASGVAKITYNITANNTDGDYFIHAFLTNSPSVQFYSGFAVSRLKVVVNSSKPQYAPGENITLNVQVINVTLGGEVNASSSSISIFTPKGEIKQAFNTTGRSQPYIINISIPNETSVLGDYPVGVRMFVNQSVGFGFAFISIKSAGAQINLSVPSIVAGESFLANLSSSASTTANLTVFSPAAKNLAYDNGSVVLSGGISQVTPVNITLASPGLYVFKAFVPGVGSETKVVSVAPASGSVPIIWTGSSVSTNATRFASNEDVYLLTNEANATATTITFNATSNETTSFSTPLNQVSGSNYYGVLNSTNTMSGNYFVRLDISSATAVATNIFSVS